ncbi:hypothetical protein PC9H_010047 [Pleurotus ostreatus]|uniref:Uncharacterized protein n=1 Tax=Pleurotus ostreatus TaxID=5322 RepID=A0A8H7DSN4_PLEOS|nr:uncharacterized protein PC9H_010047 [Pleurotus ostreatus]KAF7424736.1 hypothetical protein PC9H_010047 [Pleurotus ostreatus]
MSRQTKDLLQALIKWPVVDIKIFLVEIMEDGRQDSDELALSIIDLLLAAARQSTESCFIFLEAGMLDILLYFYLDGDLNLDTQKAAQKACFGLAKFRPPDNNVILSFTRSFLSAPLDLQSTIPIQDPIIIPLAVDRHRLRQIVICYFVPLFCAIARTSSACLDTLLNARIAELLWAIALLQDTSYLRFKQDNLNIASREYETICYDIMDEASQIFVPDASDVLSRHYTGALYSNRV